MRNLFLPGADLSQPTLIVDGPDGHHLATVLRVRVGERITALDNCGNAVETEVDSTGKQCVTLQVISAAQVAPEPAIHITVAQALGKGDKFEQVIQHVTEVGASAFIPLQMERSIVKLDNRSTEDKLKRWQAIAKGAAEQSGRARIPVIAQPTRFAELCRRTSEFGDALVLHPRGEPLPDHLASKVLHESILLIVGPEGGISQVEIGLAEAAGATTISLGDYVLRTETAALVAVAQILYAHSAGMCAEDKA